MRKKNKKTDTVRSSDKAKDESESPLSGQPPESSAEHDPVHPDKPVAPPIRVIIEGEKPR